MKKKASLLISGITTVAMLAVAVGSFAAWDNLTAQDQTLTVTSGSPAILKVDSNTNGADSSKKLVPTGAITGADEKAEVYVGNLVATITTDGTTASTDETKKNKIDISCAAPEITVNGVTNPENILDVSLYEGDSSTPITIATDKLKSGTTYKVKVKYKDASSISDENAKAIAGKLISVKLSVSAQDNTTP